MNRSTQAIGLLSAVAWLVVALSPATVRGSSGCDRVVSPGPRVVQRLVGSLSAGQVGCLRGGDYRENVRIGRGGSAGAPIVVQSYPGERARLFGRLVIAHGASDVTVQNLDLDGATSPADDSCTTAGGCGLLPSPTVDGTRVTFENVDVTNEHHGICFDLGSEAWGQARSTVIDHSRIHDCGRLPAQNHDHAIYVNNAIATQITNDWIYANADRGIQLYPSAQHTTITGNVIVGNGEGVIFASDTGMTPSSNNTVAHNIIADSTQRWNVETWWGGATGQNNLVRKNCLHASDADQSNGGMQSPEGFSTSGNVIRDPQFLDPANHDYRIPSTSPCATLYTGQTPGQARPGAPSSATSGPRKPGVTTGAADHVRRTRARLTGSVSSHGAPTRYYFAYGLTHRYGTRTSWRLAGAGVKRIAASAAIFGLRPHRLYHYRLVAKSRWGIGIGADRYFRTKNLTQ